VKTVERDGILALLLVGALVAILAAALGAALLGCKGENVPGLGPSVRTSHPSQHGKLMRAIDVAGDALQANGLADVALIVDLTVLDGFAFELERADMDVKALWGLNEIVLGTNGVRCKDTIATQDQNPEALVPSGLALAHELAHCAQDVLFMRDPRHEDRHVWDVIVPAVNAALAAEGL
jgi:hypothetical protein